MTEAEAKTKWCCGPKVIADQINASQKMQGAIVSDAPIPHFGPFENGLCIASACMAWRGHFEVTEKSYRYVDDGYGYCGLAGKL